MTEIEEIERHIARKWPSTRDLVKSHMYAAELVESIRALQQELEAMRTREQDKPPRLRIYWSKAEEDIVYHHDGERNGVAARCADAQLLHHAMDCVVVNDGRSLRQELEARGYDPETMTFSIRRKPADGGK